MTFSRPPKLLAFDEYPAPHPELQPLLESLFNHLTKDLPDGDDFPDDWPEPVHVFCKWIDEASDSQSVVHDPRKRALNRLREAHDRLGYPCSTNVDESLVLIERVYNWIAGSPLKEDSFHTVVGDPESGEHAVEEPLAFAPSANSDALLDQTQQDQRRIRELEVMLSQFKLEALTLRQREQEHELALARASASAWQAGHEAGVKAGMDWAIKGQELPTDPQPDPNGVALFQNPYVEALYVRIDKLCKLYDEAWDAVRAGSIPEEQPERPIPSRHWVAAALEAMSMTGFVPPDVAGTGPACMSDAEVQQVHRAFRAFVGRGISMDDAIRDYTGEDDVDKVIQGRDNVQAFVHDLLQELITNGVHTEAEVERMAFLHVEVVKMIAQLFWVASSKEGSRIPNYHVTTFVNPMVPEETVEFVMRRLHKAKHISFVRMQRAVDAIRTLPSGRDEE